MMKQRNLNQLFRLFSSRNLINDFNFSKYPFLQELGLTETKNLGGYVGGKWFGSGSQISSINPNDKTYTASINQITEQEYEQTIQTMITAQAAWAEWPAPKRGEIIRQIGMKVREKKEALGKLISIEMGKIYSEGQGEVQEFIDMCDLAVGMSRQLEGKIIQSERPGHFMMEVWNPLGLIGVITAFNFPLAVFGWNFALTMICGDLTLWKSATTTSLVTIATSKIVAQVLEENGVPPGVFGMLIGPGRTIGEKLINDNRIKLVSFTGSTEVGRRVSSVVHSRFGRTILELGGNNGIILMPDANVDLALKVAVFAAIGTAGQRCTSLRRLIIHESLYDDVVRRLVKAYGKIKIGSSLDSSVLLGPLHTAAAVKEYTDGIEEIKKQGGKILYGGKALPELGGYQVMPTIVEIDSNAEIINTELFVPIMYVLKFSTLEEAIRIHNQVPQGLSSSLFTNDLKNMYKWVGPNGSDCGIINVNIGTSGAEIGAAFGGEKETGGGREAGSDSWKQYMRRGTVTINYSNAFALAQGVKFEL